MTTNENTVKAIKVLEGVGFDVKRTNNGYQVIHHERQVFGGDFNDSQLILLANKEQHQAPELHNYLKAKEEA